MKQTAHPGQISLSKLLDELAAGRYTIPNFQRHFEWKPWDINDLMRSIFRDYYIGGLLLWEGSRENFQSLSCTPIHGLEGEGQPDIIVLDGQQRLTAIHYAIAAPDVPPPVRHNRYLYFIRLDAFQEENYDDAFVYFWQKFKRTELESKQEQFRQHLFPLSVISEGGFKLSRWFQDYQAYWAAEAEKAHESDEEAQIAAERHARNAEQTGEYINELVNQYQVSWMKLERQLDLGKVCEIFTKINNTGVKLSMFDLLNALLTPHGLVLKHMWDKCGERVRQVERLYALQVMSILLQNYCSPKHLYYLVPGARKRVRLPDGSLKNEFLIETADDFNRKWRSAIEGLDAALRQLQHPQEFGANSPNLLPYTAILPAFTALQIRVRDLPSDRQLAGQRKIRRWYWGSVLAQRYSGSVETTAARDYIDLCKWFEDDEATPEIVATSPEQLHVLDLKRETARNSARYKAVLNLLVIRGARDWNTGMIPDPGDLHVHHIVPKAWADRLEVGEEINSVLNQTLVSARTNQYMGARLPNSYFPELIEANGRKAVIPILASHLISEQALDLLCRDPFTANDFAQFLTERQRAVKDGFSELLAGRGLAEPQFDQSELDGAIANVELAIRDELDRTLEGNVSRLPHHLVRKAEERARQAAKRRPNIDINAHLGGMRNLLPYFDLRDLQDVVLNKGLWPLFEPRFKYKPQIAMRFDQLAELRNTIRHDRPLDDVTRKDGEAAIEWFSRLLGIPTDPVP
ncbi:MAG: DUF262 domain-containing protein [Holophagales bacterium]|nr:DUF262 domain-containing protein [Holophagales bacterium]MYG29374.1 DUF262 domain-containing protein [Holophagales bacterium]MYI80108.1 DUF262 domain-containing protein [Holophagales bacterium]